MRIGYCLEECSVGGGEGSSAGDNDGYGNVVQLLGGRDFDVANIGIWVRHEH